MRSNERDQGKTIPDVIRTACTDEKYLHDSQKSGCGGGLLKLPGNRLDPVLDVYGSDVESKGIARKPRDILQTPHS